MVTSSVGILYLASAEFVMSCYWFSPCDLTARFNFNRMCADLGRERSHTAWAENVFR